MMAIRHVRLGLAVAAGAAIAVSSLPLAAQQAAAARARVREPLPLDVAVATNGHNGRSPIDLSPDGQWVAHTFDTDDVVPYDSRRYSATGFPFAEGTGHMQAVVTHTTTGERIALGSPASLSWGAVWSPDGTRVAFYSDEGGEAGVWVWDKASRKATRFPGVIARPFFGFELVRWSSDSQRLLCKVLPVGVTIKQANALERSDAAPGRFPKVAPDQPSVFVLKSDAKDMTKKPATPAPAPGAAPGSKPGPKPVVPRKPPQGDVAWMQTDLAILDLRTRAVTRIVERTPIRAFAFSPDDTQVAYTVLKGWEADSQQPSLDLIAYTVATKARRTIAENARMGYGIEWNWSPDSRRLAYIESGQLATGAVIVTTVADGATQEIRGDDLPNFGAGEGENPPLWDPRSTHIYAAGEGKLWRLDPGAGKGTMIGDIPGWSIRGIVSRPAQPAMWLGRDGSTAWVVAREGGQGQRSGLFSIDVASGTVTPALQEAKSYSSIFNLDASDAGDIVFVATDQQHLRDVWVLSAADGRARQASHLNEGMERYELGTATTIAWHSRDGQPLRGALLLPPGYQQGRRLPLVVWVYGGSNGSASVNSFGFWGESPALNMHVLATRGYAVLFPDAPLRTGSTFADLANTVLPGVNAAIDQGYADPDRLAVMGQSYGSYSTLALIAQTPRFKAAVITAAVLHPDLLTDYLKMNPDGSGSTGYWEQGQGNMGGTPWEFPGRYAENSPIFLFDRIQTPLLIGQGEKDGNLVPSDATYVALQRLGKPVEYRIYEGEGHVIVRKPNVLDFWKRRLDFFAEHLDLTLDANGGIVFEGDRAKSRRAAANATRPTGY